jgi:cell division protein FtsW
MASSNAAVRSTRRPVNSRSRSEKARLRPGHPAVLLSIAVGALLFLGLIMILSASSVSAFATYGSSFLFFQRQVMWALVGLLCFVFFARLDYHRLSGFGYVLLPLVIGLLFAVLIPGVGVVSGGSARWISLGLFSFQPSEIAKLALVLFAADVFSRKDESTFDSFSHTTLPLIPALGILAVLVLLQPDLGTTLVLGSIGIGVLFVAGAPISFLSPIVMAGGLVTTAAALAEPYRRARIFAFLNPWADPFNTGYQTIQSLIAVGSGGWFGVGLGASRQKWLYVPNAHTDFIYAILAEETGLLGTFVVLGLFAFLTYMGIRTARRAPDRFGTLLAAGITIWIALQALVNIGAVIAALPITGVPLPLVSFGGTSLVVLLIAAGVLVNIAYQAESGPPQRTRSRRSRQERSRIPAKRPASRARSRSTTRRGAAPTPASRTRGRGR